MSVTKATQTQTQTLSRGPRLSPSDGAGSLSVSGGLACRPAVLLQVPCVATGCPGGGTGLRHILSRGTQARLGRRLRPLCEEDAWVCSDERGAFRGQEEAHLHEGQVAAHHPVLLLGVIDLPGVGLGGERRRSESPGRG